MKRKRLIPIIVLLLAAAGAAYYYFNYVRSPEADTSIKISGHIEVTEVDMSFRIAGHVEKLFVDEGDSVKKDEPIAVLDQTVFIDKKDQAKAMVDELRERILSMDTVIGMKEELLDADVERAKAGVSAAKERYLSLERGSREQEIREAQANIDRAKAELDQRKRDLARMKRLYENNIIAASRYEDSFTARDSAQAAYDAALERFRLVKEGPRKENVSEGKANLEGSKASLTMAEASVREVKKLKHDRNALKAQLDQARAALALAEYDLAESTIYAPFDGFVTVKDVEQDEFVQPGTPVLTVAHLADVWVRTYVPETQLGRVRLGQQAEVTTDTFPDKIYPGVVTFISPVAEFTPKNVQTKEERVKLVYRIKVTVDNAKRELKVGMPVDVVLR